MPPKKQTRRKIKIEAGIPFPHRFLTYPFDKMKVGDSFLMPQEDKDPNRLRVLAHHYGKSKKMKFSIKKTEEGVRCWRIK